RFPREETMTDDDEPFSIDGLDTWRLRTKLLDESVTALKAKSDSDPEAILVQLASRLQGRGELPLPPFGAISKQELFQPLLQTLHDCHQRLREHPLIKNHTVHIEYLEGNL